MIIETCPKCGGLLLNSIIATFPPYCKKECLSCGWFEEQREEIIYQPFKEKINDEDQG